MPVSAIALALADGGLGIGCGDAGASVVVVEAQQEVAGLDAVVDADGDLGDAAGGLGAEADLAATRLDPAGRRCRPERLTGGSLLLGGCRDLRRRLPSRVMHTAPAIASSAASNEADDGRAICSPWLQAFSFEWSYAWMGSCADGSCVGSSLRLALSCARIADDAGRPRC